MPREKNIFHNLVKNENNFTELFVNFLQIDEFRSVFIKFLKEKLDINNLDFTYEDITTQYTDGDCRPDIVIKNEQFHILIENKTKINTAPTTNQSEGAYNKMLSDSLTSKLIYIVPRLYKYRDKIKDNVVLSWEDIVHYFDVNLSSKDNLLLMSFINLSNDFFSYKKIEIDKQTLDMINSKDNSFIKLKRLVDNLFTSLKERYPNLDIKREAKHYEYSIYIRKKDQLILYVGIWYSLWENKGVPLCIMLDDTSPEIMNDYFEKNEAYKETDVNDVYSVINVDLEKYSDDKALFEYISTIVENCN